MAEVNPNLTALDNMISHLKNTNLITSSTFSPSKLPLKPLSMFSYKRPPSPVEGDMGTYTVDEFVQKYKNDPELRKLPLPNFVYEKYGIPKPEVLGLNTYLIKSDSTIVKVDHCHIEEENYCYYSVDTIFSKK